MVVGPVIVALMGFGVYYAFAASGAADPYRRRLQFLAWIGVPFFVMTAAAALLAKVQVNWPAPAYFTLLILAAYFLSTRLRTMQTWQPWRWWFWGTVAIWADHVAVGA